MMTDHKFRWIHGGVCFWDWEDIKDGSTKGMNTVVQSWGVQVWMMSWKSCLHVGLIKRYKVHSEIPLIVSRWIAMVEMWMAGKREVERFASILQEVPGSLVCLPPLNFFYVREKLLFKHLLFWAFLGCVTEPNCTWYGLFSVTHSEVRTRIESIRLSCHPCWALTGRRMSIRQFIDLEQIYLSLDSRAENSFHGETWKIFKASGKSEPSESDPVIARHWSNYFVFHMV